MDHNSKWQKKKRNILFLGGVCVNVVNEWEEEAS